VALFQFLVALCRFGKIGVRPARVWFMGFLVVSDQLKHQEHLGRQEETTLALFVGSRTAFLEVS
jgi:hypothetical protein